MSTLSKLPRRRFLQGGAASLFSASSLAFPGISRASSRPVISHGLQSGDVGQFSGMIWARADRFSKMHVEISSTESFANAKSLAPIYADPTNDFAAKRVLTGLPADQDIFYRVQFSDVNDPRALSEPMVGHFKTAPTEKSDIRFAWSGDTAGQGWGIDINRGGMQTYSTMASHQPDFFIHCGDTIYADGPISAQQEMPNGEIWNNLVAEGVDKVAETLAEFRGRWKYNLLDENVRNFNAQVPTYYQWDDHEVVNNWSSAKDLSEDARYTEKSVGLLRARSAKAFHEMTPISFTPAEPGRVYRKVSYGPLLDIFFLDLRSYRGPNTDGMQTEINATSQILGDAQLQWLKREMSQSTATWKVISCDMPLGLVIWDWHKEEKRVEAVSNGDHGAAKGRELEFAELLRYIKQKNIHNVVWFTADVHYTAAHYYDPNKAQFQDFAPFWEFVSGPLHAGTFGPNDLDMTFGPEVKYVKAPSKEQGVNLPPSMGLQFFGLVDIAADTEQMTVRLMDRDDAELYSVVLDPVGTA